MSTEDEKLEKVRKFLSRGAGVCDHVLVYRGKKNKGETEIKWIKAASLSIESREDCEQLAAKYQTLATHCYQRRQNMILEEQKGSQTIPWLGLTRPTGEVTPSPANSLGQRWWHLVVASGPTRRAGYIIVTKVAAKEAKDLYKYIAEIQSIVAGAGYFLRQGLVLVSFLNSVRTRKKIA